MHTIIFLVAGLILSEHAMAKNNVLEELAKLQKEKRLSLAWYEWGVRNIVFANHSQSLKKLPPPAGNAQEGMISSDGTQMALILRSSHDAPYLAIVDSGGTDLREYQHITPGGTMCWSPQGSKIAIVVNNASSKSSELQILDLNSGSTQPIQTNSYVSSQCWSPDGTQIVYETDESIRVYDVLLKKWHELAHGSFPTWSADGSRVSFLDRGSYYAISMSDAKRELLFTKNHAVTPLWWSPDSRFVAYVTGKIGPGIPHIWIRRVQDNSEVQVGERPDVPYIPDYQWLQQPKAAR